jgi:hypothetical protein
MPNPIPSRPAPTIFVTDAGMPVNGSVPVPVPESPEPLLPLEPDVDPSDVPLAAAVVVVEPVAAVVAVVDPLAVVAAVVEPLAAVVVGDELPEVPVLPGRPGTADHTNPLGSEELAVKVISVFQLSVRRPALVTQAMPASHTPLVLPV